MNHQNILHAVCLYEPALIAGGYKRIEKHKAERFHKQVFFTVFQKLSRCSYSNFEELIHTISYKKCMNEVVIASMFNLVETPQLR